MMFTIPLANPFGGQAAVSVDQQDMTAAGSLQAKIKAQAAFANINTANATDTVSTADTKIDTALTATGTDT